MSLPRLLLVLTEFPPSFGGMQTHAVYLCRHLVERGYSITVATYRTPSAAVEDAALPFAVHRRLSRVSYWENLRALTTLASECRADVIYASTVFYGALRTLTGLPVVCRSPGNDILRPWIAWPYEALSRTLSRPAVEDRLFERFRRLDWPERLELLLLHRRRQAMIHSACQHTRVLANSVYTAGLLDGIGLDAAQVRVLPGGVDSARSARREQVRDSGSPRPSGKWLSADDSLPATPCPPYAAQCPTLISLSPATVGRLLPQWAWRKNLAPWPMTTCTNTTGPPISFCWPAGSMST